MELTILRTELDTSQTETRCLVWFQIETGETWVRGFPLEALEWRAAEYGIDPADVDTLLDVVLHEEHAEPTTLVDDPDIDTARERHLARIANAKKRARFVEVPEKAARGGKVDSPATGLQKIKDAYAEFMDPAEVESKARAVESARAAHAARKAATKTLSDSASPYGRRKRPNKTSPPTTPIELKAPKKEK